MKALTRPSGFTADSSHTGKHVRIHLVKWLVFNSRCCANTSKLSSSVRLKTFESVLCMHGPVGALSQEDVEVLKTAVAKQIVKPPVTGMQFLQR